MSRDKEYNFNIGDTLKAYTMHYRPKILYSIFIVNDISGYKLNNFYKLNNLNYYYTSIILVEKMTKPKEDEENGIFKEDAIFKVTHVG